MDGRHMDLSVEVILNDAALRYCEQYRKTFTNKLTNPERVTREDEQYDSKLAEVAVAKYVGMDFNVFDKLAKSTADYDVLTERGMRGDVKSSNKINGDTLFWPVKKIDEYDKRWFDFLVFCNTYRCPIIEIRGWMWKQEFREFHETAGCGDKLIAGTWFWSRPFHDPVLLTEGLFSKGVRLPV